MRVPLNEGWAALEIRIMTSTSLLTCVNISTVPKAFRGLLGRSKSIVDSSRLVSVLKIGSGGLLVCRLTIGAGAVRFFAMAERLQAKRVFVLLDCESC